MVVLEIEILREGRRRRYEYLQKQRCGLMRRWIHFMLHDRKAAAGHSPEGIERQATLWQECKEGLLNGLHNRDVVSPDVAEVEIRGRGYYAWSEAHFWYRYLRLHYGVDAITRTWTARVTGLEATGAAAGQMRRRQLCFLYAATMWRLHSAEEALLRTVLDRVSKGVFSLVDGVAEANKRISEYYATVLPVTWSLALEVADGLEPSIEFLCGYVLAEAEVRQSMRRMLRREHSGSYKQGLLVELPGEVASRDGNLTPKTITRLPGRVVYQIEKDLRLEFDQHCSAGSRTRLIYLDDPDAVPGSVPDPCDPLLAFVNSEELQAWARANLTEKERAAFHEVWELGYSVPEVAARLQANPNTLYARLAQVRKKMRSAVGA